VPQPVRVDERTEREDTHRILRLSAVADFRDAPQPLNHLEVVLHHRADPGTTAVDLIGSRCVLPFLALQIPPPARFPLLLILGLVIGLVAMHRRFRAVQSWVVSAVATLVVVMDWITPGQSVPMCTFTPKNHWFPLRVCRISGSRYWVAFLVILGAPMMVATTIVPALMSSILSASSVLTAPNIWAVKAAAPARGGCCMMMVSSGTVSCSGSILAKRRMASES
jgi:hypothetical protein